MFAIALPLARYAIAIRVEKNSCSIQYFPHRFIDESAVLPNAGKLTN